MLQFLIIAVEPGSSELQLVSLTAERHGLDCAALLEFSLLLLLDSQIGQVIVAEKEAQVGLGVVVLEFSNLGTGVGSGNSSESRDKDERIDQKSNILK